MFLSKLILDPRRRDARRDLAAPYEMHRTLLRAFPNECDGGPGRVLFRVEPHDDARSSVVIVQSEKLPNWSRLPEGYAHVLPVKTVRYVAGGGDASAAAASEVVVPIGRGDLYRFRLVANPTIKREGKRHALWKEPDQVAWLIRKGRDGGFETNERTCCVIPAGRLESRRRQGDDGPVATISHYAVRFEGALWVTDPLRFVVTLELGIGSAKGFGFGLLSLARG